MRGLKVVVPFAACGFLLSFVAGLFSHSSFLSILLKALIFALVFGLLGFGISFLFKKFLSDGTGADFQSEYTADSSAAPAGNSALGQNVDITIQDEELRPSESENHFVVGDNHQMLNDSDVRNKGNAAQEPDSSQGFVPLRNFETVQNLSGKEAVIPSEAIASEAAPEKSAPVNIETNIEGGIDTLPDMENFVYSDASESGSNDDDSDAVTESEFVSSVSSNKKNDGPAEVQDAALMAKAISSVLSDENS